MRLTSRVSWFLLLVGAWNWYIWPTFLVNINADPRSWAAGQPTSFLLVHLVLIAVSLAIGTALLVIGFRGVRAARRGRQG